MPKTDNWTIIVQRKRRSAFDMTVADRLISSGLSIAQVAAKLGVSVPTLRRSFVRYHGVTPRQWLTATRHKTTIAARVREAEPLIASRKLPIVKIAEIVGFGSHQALALAFKRIHGVSPTCWRSANQP